MRSRRFVALLSVALTAVAVAWLWSPQQRARPAVRGLLDRDSTAAAPRALSESDRTASELEPDDARRLGQSGVIAGRVVDVDTGLGLNGFWTQLWCAGELAGEVGSDPLGHFLLPEPPASDGDDPQRALSVRVQAPWGWTLLERSRVVERRDDGGSDELEFRARRSRFAKLSARVVDELTGEPLPHFMLRVGTHDGQREQVSTDEHGSFTTAREYAEGSLLVFAHDLESSDQGATEERVQDSLEIEHDPLAREPQTIPVAVGPTYHLALDAPPEVARGGLLAELVSTGFPGRSSVSGTLVRGVEARWVRFGPRYGWDGPLRGSWSLRVVSADGLWCGAGPITSRRGIHPTLVTIRFEARGQLLGRLRDREGGPIGQATVRLASLAADGEPIATTTSGGNGLFVFELLPEGPYLVTAISPVHAIGSARVDVRAGQITESELVLDRAAIAGAIAGRLVAHEPQRFSPRVGLASLNPGGRYFDQAVTFERRGEQWIGAFRFDALPAGDYELSVDFGEWSPALQRIKAPAEGLLFTQQPSSTCVGFIAVDAATGAVLPACSALLLSSGCEPRPWRLEGAGDCIDHVGELDLDARWIVAADGYAPCWGERAQLAASEDGFTAHAELARGWGIEFAVLGPGLVPLAGVEIVIDGELAARTDRDGLARIVRGSKPARIQLGYRDWSVDPDSQAELREALAGAKPRADAFLSPR